MLRVIEATDVEHAQLAMLATAKNYNFQTKDYWEVCYYYRYEYLPSGLWYKVLSLTRMERPYKVEIRNINDFVRTQITKESLHLWVQSQGLIYDPRYYQADAFFKLVRFPRSKAEIGTGGGKTFTACMISRYYIQNIIDKDQKVLIIVPRRALVDQFLKDMKTYCDDGLLIIDSIYSGGKRYANSNVIVGTYQSLSTYDKEFFEDIGMVLVDEAHTATSNSIRKEILPKINWMRCHGCHGMTGTEPADAVGRLTLEAYIGPTLQYTTTTELEDAGAIVPTKVTMVEFVHTRETAKIYYNAEETQAPTPEKLKFEKELILYEPKRLKTIVGVLNKLPENCIMLFHTLAYAQFMYDYFTHNSDKTVYLVSGKTSNKERQRIFEEFAQRRDGIIFATYGTMSTGISINNIHYIASADGGKAMIIVYQTIGRGVRLAEGKEFLQYIDFYDTIPKYDKKWGSGNSNIFTRHAEERRKLYDSRNTEHKTKTINLS